VIDLSQTERDDLSEAQIAVEGEDLVISLGDFSVTLYGFAVHLEGELPFNTIEELNAYSQSVAGYDVVVYVV
jgi:hypothetical protein